MVFPTVVFQGEQCTVIKAVYQNGRTRLDLYCDGPYATATVNVPEVELEQGETLIKNYAENEGIFQVLLDAGIVEDTGKRAKSRFVEMPIVRVLI